MSAFDRVVLAVVAMMVGAGAAIAAPEGTAALQARADELNDACRGGSGDNPKTMRACEDRDAAVSQLKRAGVCWGHEGQAGYQRTWEQCDRRPTQGKEQAPPQLQGAGAKQNSQLRPSMAFAMVGPERIDLPSPKGMGSAKDVPDIEALFRAGLRPGDRLAAVFVVPAEVEELRQGRQEHLSRYALVRIIGGAERVRLSPDDWVAGKAEMKRVLPGLVKPASGYEGRVREIGDQIGEMLRDRSFGLRLDQLTSLGVIGETAESLSVGQIGRVSATLKSGVDSYVALRIATTLHVRERSILLEYVAEIAPGSTPDVRGALAAASAWSELVLRANAAGAHGR